MLTLDANVLVYAVDARDPGKQQSAMTIIEAAAGLPSKVGLQVLGEFFVASTRKIRVPVEIAQQRLEYLLTIFETFPHTRMAVAQAAARVVQRRFSYWDALLLASADEAGCTTMLSEDMADGTMFGNLVVRNPFSPSGLSHAAQKALGLID